LKFGIEQNTIDAINNCLESNTRITEAIIYGSRAIGNFKAGSDIDLTLKGKDLDLTDINKIENQIDDLLLPYKFDISIMKQINNNDLLDHINRIGIIFYSRAEE